FNCRLALKQEKEEKGNADMLLNKDSERLRTKEEECGKEVETKQPLKWTPRRLVKELKMARDNLDLVVQERNDIQKQLSEEQNARILQDQILTSKQKELEIAQKKINSEVDLIEAQETAPSRCLHLDAENEVLQFQQTLFSMKAIRMQCETLQKNKKQLKREVVNLKSYMERNMLAHAEAEQHKRLIEEKARKEIAEKVNEDILTLQLREDNTTVKTQMELTIKDLESEISRIKTSAANFNKTELERYKVLYLEEVKVRESLSNELNR
ncbi:PREDICTED: putative coiled-coil domain-containing protein 144C, partial [Colobus angolensis palliatus]|uniref:putative coiled-coil domain-containing protein 144C n=1 Tax=Colobus angolensis palliatus TaxID=336983 RepID=UPI0005F400E7